MLSTYLELCSRACENADGKENSVEQDQTKEQSDWGLHSLLMPIYPNNEIGNAIHVVLVMHQTKLFGTNLN